MNVKIYFNNKPLFLTDSLDEEINDYVHHDDAVFIDELSNPGVNSMIHEMQTEKVHAGIYYHSNLEALKKAVWKKFRQVSAAGGLVFNEKSELLLIFRRGKWDLPKGKQDEGESSEACAIREVMEETGLVHLKPGKFLLKTYHTYNESGHHFLKETSWYTFEGKSSDPLVPQINEQIDRVIWVKKEKLKEYAGKTYAAILDVWKAGGLI